MVNKTLWISVTVFVVLAVLFAFTDLPIMQVYADPGSGWGHFMQAYGQLPGMLVGFLGSSILLRQSKLGKSIKTITKTIGLLLITTLMALGFWGDALGMQVDSEINIPVLVILAIAMLICVQLLFRRIPDETMQKFKAFGQVAVLLYVLAGLITVWGIKIPWGRWTYRDMLEVGDLSLYTPWYLPQGVNGHHSFISGHTAFSFCVLPVVLLLRGNQKQYRLAWILAVTWGLLGALSRVAIGAHFPSDVLFGGGQTLLWFWILRKRILK